MARKTKPVLPAHVAAQRAVMPPSEQDFHFRYAIIGIGLATFLRLLWLAGRPIDLYPDEAQYWIWAQHPHWGYFSKPPMVAWIIALTTRLFGEGDLAVKATLGLALKHIHDLQTYRLERHKGKNHK